MVHESAEDSEIHHLEELQVAAAQAVACGSAHSFHRPALLLHARRHGGQSVRHRIDGA